MISQQMLTAIFGAIASVGVACAGIYKFFAWLLERHYKKKMSAAKALASLTTEDKLTQELRSFGSAHLRRMYFSGVTGLDVERGHNALLRLHAELGGRDGVWLSLRGVKEHLLLSRTFVRVRRLKRTDIEKIILATLGGFASFCGMLLVSIPIIMTIVEMLNERISFLRAFSQLSVSLSFTTLLGFTGLLAIRWAGRRVNAACFRASIYQVRRRKKSRFR